MGIYLFDLSLAYQLPAQLGLRALVPVSHRAGPATVARQTHRQQWLPFNWRMKVMVTSEPYSSQMNKTEYGQHLCKPTDICSIAL
jgi:hypothetical protein